jgi:hypothetical protein
MIDLIERLLAAIATPALVVKHSPLDRPLLHQYRWKLWTASEPMKCVDTIKFEKGDILRVIGKNEDQIVRYLMQRFGARIQAATDLHTPRLANVH